MDNSVLTIKYAAKKAAEFSESMPPFPGGFDGRGIVICAGGIRYLTCAWVLIKILRHLGCRLPIEIWYLGEDEGDRDWIDLVRPLGVTCINAKDVCLRHPHRRLRGWESKPYAILHSSFREVLFLDADNVPVVDPTYLFDEPEYRRTGTVFWPDPEHFRTPADSPRWTVFGVPYRPEPDMESGQLLIDKQRSWAALNLCNWYNEHSDFFYQYVYGDKDTFRFAWHRVGQSFAMPKRFAEDMPHTLLQFDFQGKPLFQHRFGAKWSLQFNREIVAFQYESLCRDFVAELRERWNPVRHLTRQLTAADRAGVSRLAGHWYYERVGFVGWPLHLSENNSVTEGWAAKECYWWCQENRLVMAGADGKPSCRLERQGDGTWLSAAPEQNSVRIRMRPTACQ